MSNMVSGSSINPPETGLLKNYLLVADSFKVSEPRHKIGRFTHLIFKVRFDSLSNHLHMSDCWGIWLPCGNSTNLNAGTRVRSVVENERFAVPPCVRYRAQRNIEVCALSFGPKMFSENETVSPATKCYCWPSHNFGSSRQKVVRRDREALKSPATMAFAIFLGSEFLENRCTVDNIHTSNWRSCTDLAWHKHNVICFVAFSCHIAKLHLIQHQALQTSFGPALWTTPPIVAGQNVGICWRI